MLGKPSTPTKRSLDEELSSSAKRLKEATPGASKPEEPDTSLSSESTASELPSELSADANFAEEGKAQLEKLYPYENRQSYKNPAELISSVVPDFAFQPTTFTPPTADVLGQLKVNWGKAARAVKATDQTDVGWVGQVAECSAPASEKARPDLVCHICLPSQAHSIKQQASPPSPRRLAAQPPRMSLSRDDDPVQPIASSSMSEPKRSATSFEATFLQPPADLRLSKKPDIVFTDNLDPSKKLAWGEAHAVAELTVTPVPLPSREQVNDKVAQLGLSLYMMLASMPTRFGVFGLLMSGKLEDDGSAAGSTKGKGKKNSHTGQSRENTEQEEEKDAGGVKIGGVAGNEMEEGGGRVSLDLYLLTATHLGFTRVEDCWGTGLESMSQVLRFLLYAPLHHLGFLRDLLDDNNTHTRPSLLKLPRAVFCLDEPGGTGSAGGTTSTMHGSDFGGGAFQHFKCDNGQVVTFGPVDRVMSHDTLFRSTGRRRTTVFSFEKTPDLLLKLSWLPSAFSVKLTGQVVVTEAGASGRVFQEEEVRVPGESVVMAYLNTVEELKGSIPQLVAAVTLGPLVEPQRICNLVLMSGQGKLLKDVVFKSEEDCYAFLADVFRVFGLLHKSKVGHKDPSSRNILYMNGRCFLIDFEASAFHASLCDNPGAAVMPTLLELMGTARSDAFFGTPSFMSLEAIASGNKEGYAWSPSQEIESVALFALLGISHFLLTTLPATYKGLVPALPPLPYAPLGATTYSAKAFDIFRAGAETLASMKQIPSCRRAGELIAEILAVQYLVPSELELRYWAARKAEAEAESDGWAPLIRDQLENAYKKMAASRQGTFKQRTQKLEEIFTKYAKLAQANP